MSRYKIKPILHRDLIIKTKQDQHNFFRKRPTLPRVFTVKSAEIMRFYADTEDTRKFRAGFLKIIPMLKCIKFAHLEDSHVFNFNENRALKIFKGAKLYIIKRMRQIKALSLKELVAHRDNLTCLNWLKFAKRLKSFMYSIQASYFHRNEDGLRRKLKLMSTWLNRVKMRRFEINDRRVVKKDFLYYKYPKTLECLGLDISGNLLTRKIDKEYLSSKFANLTNLKKLSLNLEAKEDVIAVLLNSASDLPQLTILDLELKKFTKTTVSEIDPFLNSVRRLQQLKSLRLYIHVWSTTLESLFDAFKDCPITTFSLKGSPSTSDNDDLSYLSSFLAELKNLASLELNFKNSKNLCLSAEYLLPVLREVMSKPMPLTSFSLAWNRFEAQKVFPELVNLLTGIAQGLKVVKISIGKYQPDDKQFKEMIQFLRNLTVIHTLELCNMNISGSRSLETIANIVWSYKNIRVFAIGKVLKPKPRQQLVKAVEKIIKKTGLERFGCDIGTIHTFPTSKYTERNIDYIDFNTVCLKNPYLEPWGIKYLS